MPTAEGLLGIGSSRTYDQMFELKTINYGFLASIPAGISKGFKTIGDYLKQFKVIFSRHTKAYESLGGFITIGSIFPGVWDWQSFWNLTALLVDYTGSNEYTSDTGTRRRTCNVSAV